MLNLYKIFSGLAGSAVPRLRSNLGLVVPSLESVAPIIAPGASLAATVLVDAASIALDATLGNLFILDCTTDAVREFAVPTGGTAGQRIAVRIVNTSGGALTNTTFAALIRSAALTLPATTFQRDYDLEFDGTDWAIVNFSPADIPN